MIEVIRQSRFARIATRASEWAQSWLVPAMLRRRTFSAALVAILLAMVYWGLVASDRYVSEAHVVIQRADLNSGQSMELSSLLGNAGGGAESDQRLLRDHLLSVDMLEKLQARFDLRKHYSDRRRDPLARMWFADAPLEWFHDHYVSRVRVDFDSTSGILFIRAQAYDPQTAHAIAAMLVEEGERAMNDMAQRMAQEQVRFLERQADGMRERVLITRRALIDFQNRNGLISPQGTVESLAAVVNRLEAQIADLQARRTAMLGYLAPQAPAVVEVDLQIDAMRKQIANEQSRLVSPAGTKLNVVLEEYQRLQIAADFAQDVYKTALVALEKGRVEAIRTLKKVSVLQAPTQPEYPLEPRRIYSIAVFILVTLLLAGVVHLLAAIIRDHKD